MSSRLLGHGRRDSGRGGRAGIDRLTRGAGVVSRREAVHLVGEGAQEELLIARDRFRREIKELKIAEDLANGGSDVIRVRF